MDRRALGFGRAGRALARTARRSGSALLEAFVAGLARVLPRIAEPPREPRSILVLRNNDLGDLLVVTPLFEALRRRFPGAHIAAAVGRWNVGTLKGNPHLSKVLVTGAPWFNKFVRHQGPLAALRYIALSPEARRLRADGFDIGIDVLGSAWGALLMLRAGIPYRLGVAGYAGGHSAAQGQVRYDPWEHVGRSALRFAELLGATDLPPCRPQIFLDTAEAAAGEAGWRWISGEARPQQRRVVVAPGGGSADKCWPLASYEALVWLLAADGETEIAVAGGPRERQPGERLAAAAPGARNLAGHLSLRESFALIAAADLVIANSSVWMHAAAAFSRPTLVLLGESVASARQHDAQWGYPGTCVSLGKEPGERADLYNPGEVLEAAREILGRSGGEQR